MRPRGKPRSRPRTARRRATTGGGRRARPRNRRPCRRRPRSAPSMRCPPGRRRARRGRENDVGARNAGLKTRKRGACAAAPRVRRADQKTRIAGGRPPVNVEFAAYRTRTGSRPRRGRARDRSRKPWRAEPREGRYVPARSAAEHHHTRLPMRGRPRPGRFPARRTDPDPDEPSPLTVRARGDRPAPVRSPCGRAPSIV
jgi:hypothetical protein